MIGTHAPQVIRLLVLSGFFVFTGVCIVRGRTDERFKTVFTVALVVCLLVPTVSGILFPPFADWHFFPYPAPQNTTSYTATLVDADGDEFDFPREAAPPGRVYNRAERISKGTTSVDPDRMAYYLLERAREHRRSLRDGISPGELLRYRGTSDQIIGRDTWSVSEARGMDRLSGLRVYRTVMNTSANSYDITDRNRTMVYEYWANSSR